MCLKKRLTAFHYLLMGRECEDTEVERLWMLSLISKEYRVTPPEAEDLLYDETFEWIIPIMELRAYARAKASYDSVDGDV